MPHDINSEPTPSQPTQRQVTIPENLHKQLLSFRKRLWKVKITEAVLAGVFGLLVSFLVVFALDRFIETPAPARLIILIGGVSFFAIFAPFWIHRWVYKHRHESQLARLIAKHYPRLGDRLLGAVELQSQTETQESLSPALRAAALRTVAAEAASRDLTHALPPSRHRSWSLVIIGLFIIAATALIFSPKAGTNALKRWLTPLSDTARFTYTQLDLSDLGKPHHIPYGETFTVRIPLHQDSKRSPAIARARYGDGKWITATLQSNAYTFEFPGQRFKDLVNIVAGDANYEATFEPIIRPAIETTRAHVELPAYLNRKAHDVDLRSGFLTALKGSEITIRANTSRQIFRASATAQKQPLNQPLNPYENSEHHGPKDPVKTPQSKDIKLTLRENTITTAPIPVQDHSLIIPINWIDVFGLAPSTPLKIRIESTQDQAPTTYIQGVDRQHIMLEEETLNFEVLAEDDYGLKTCGISWLGQPSQPTTETRTKGEIILKKGNPNQTTLNIPWSFSPKNHNITPQKITLRSWTKDYLPGRSKIYSDPITLYVLTRDEHAQVLKNEFDRTLNELEDIARKEQNLNDENKRLMRKSGEKLQEKPNKRKLENQQDKERQNKERLLEQSQKMEQLFKDAVRNGEINKSTLQKMNRTLQQMKELAQKDLPKIERKLEQSQDQRNTPEKTKEDLKEAVEQQDKAIEKMKKAIKEANEANKEFEAATFINRLKRVASQAENIASTFINIINHVIGADISEVDPAHIRTIKAAAKQQNQTAADIRWIQEDLNHFYNRTQKEEHKKIADEMHSSRINEAMEQLTSKVTKNISWKSTLHAKLWAGQLRKWAKQLQGDMGQGGNGSGGSGGGGGNQEDQDFEFMLKVMRMIQKEQDIRARTRSLEDFRRTLNIQQINPEPSAR